MAIKTTAREMAPSGNKHEHIAWLKWMDPDTKAGGWKTRADMVAYVEKNGTESVWCPDRDPSKKGAWVHVNHNDYVKYCLLYTSPSPSCYCARFHNVPQSTTARRTSR